MGTNIGIALDTAGVTATMKAKASKDEKSTSDKDRIESIDIGRQRCPPDYTSYISLVILLVITLVTYPRWGDHNSVSWQHVGFYGWLTCISTGGGVIPFFFVQEPQKFWMGVSNALAGGMMVAASYSLLYEGYYYGRDDIPAVTEEIGDAHAHPAQLSSGLGTLIGFICGLAFISVTKQWLDQCEGLRFGELNGADAQKMVLIIFVMALHSVSEGIGIGVSFGGHTGIQLGRFISLSLAVHNVPEGLAVALVLLPKRVSKVKTILWAIFTSLPQPLFAVLAFLFVEHFSSMLPVGLGFAAGAMIFVAMFELAPEAIEASNTHTAAGVGVIACSFMIMFQEAIKDNV